VSRLSRGGQQRDFNLAARQSRKDRGTASSATIPQLRGRKNQVANIIDYRLAVLATSPEEINRIASRLKQPSSELLNWVAKKHAWNPGEIAQSLTELVTFKPVKNLFYVHESVNKARRFENSFKRFTGIVDSHVFEVSAEFPNAVFLLDYRDMQYSYSGKMVIHAGEIVRESFDGRQQSQALDWALLDIFAPFVAEWNEGLPFGSLWAKWVENTKAALKRLEMNSGASKQQVTTQEVC
jgi:hypothetical protein